MTPLQQLLSLFLVASAALNALTLLQIFDASRTDHDFEPALASELPLSVNHQTFKFIFGKHYDLVNDTEWASLIPPFNGNVKLASPPQEFGVGMFSDLHCLDAIRRALVQMRDGTSVPFEGAEHCFGQLRQAVDCTADITLEPAHMVCADDGDCSPSATGNYLDHRCRSWEQVREFVEANQASWN
ncbi:hypothetical protein C8R47DRAFT_1203310 [Mycena vitilis]|nr:hypothetical protein C8R47DRAFT_1203310 [Mycena vitilis]